VIDKTGLSHLLSDSDHLIGVTQWPLSADRLNFLFWHVPSDDPTMTRAMTAILGAVDDGTYTAEEYERLEDLRKSEPFFNTRFRRIQGWRARTKKENNAFNKFESNWAEMGKELEDDDSMWRIDQLRDGRNGGSSRGGGGFRPRRNNNGSSKRKERREKATLEQVAEWKEPKPKGGKDDKEDKGGNRRGVGGRDVPGAN
jgi:hypothetical protein